MEEKSLEEVWDMYNVFRRDPQLVEAQKKTLWWFFQKYFNNSSSIRGSLSPAEKVYDNLTNLFVQTKVTPQLSYYLIDELSRVIKESYPSESLLEPINEGNLEEIWEGFVRDAERVAIQKYLLEDFGGKILKMMSELELKSITVRRNLVHILISIFPKVKWDEDPQDYLEDINQDQMQAIFNLMYFQSPNPKQKKPEHLDKIQLIIQRTAANQDLIENLERDVLVKSTLAVVILQILEKFLECEDQMNLVYIDDGSVTLSCLDFSILNLDRLCREQIFGERDQTVIMKMMLKILYLSLNNFMSTNFNKDIVVQNFSDISDLAKEFKNVTFECGILVALLGIANNFFVKQPHNTWRFIPSLQAKAQGMLEILERIANTEPHLLYKPQKMLVKVVRNINKMELPSTIEFYKKFQSKLPNTSVVEAETSEPEPAEEVTQRRQRKRQKSPPKSDTDDEIKKKGYKEKESTDTKRFHKKRQKTGEENLIIHHCSFGMKKSTCTFEKLLLESLAMTDNPRNNRMLLKHFHQNKICCCNGTPKTISTILNLNLMQNYCLHFIKKQILMPMFYAKEVCNDCSLKQNSQDFEREFFGLLKGFVLNENCSNLDLYLYHVEKISEVLPYNYCNTLLSVIVLPIFRREKLKYLEDVERNLEAKNLLIACLNIILICLKDIRTVQCYFNSQNVKHIRDLSMVPDFAKNVCSLLKIAIDNLGHLGENECEQKELAQLVLNIPNKNAVYLIEELGNIYRDLQLKKEFHRKIREIEDVPRRITEDPPCHLEEIYIKTSVETHKVDPEKCPLHDSLSVKLESSDGRRRSADLEDYEVLGETTIIIEENLSLEKILYLSSLYFTTISKLLNTSSKFQLEFINQTQKKYDNNLLFNLFYNTVNAILLSNELELEDQNVMEYQIRLPKFENYCVENLETSVSKPNEISANYYRKILSDFCDFTYQSVMDQYEFFKMNLCLLELLSIEKEESNESSSLEIFKLKRGHKLHSEPISHYSENEFFSLFNIVQFNNQSLIASEPHASNDNRSQPIYQRIFKNILLEKQIISDKLYELFMRFVNFKGDANSERRMEIIKELHNGECLNSLNSIASAALEILFKITTITNLDFDMNVALCELKSLLLQQSENYWDSVECGKTILNTLMLLIKVAESRKVYCGNMNQTPPSPPFHVSKDNQATINQTSENAYIAPLQNGNTDNIFSDIDSCEGEVLDTIGGNKEETDEDQNTEENYISADESYDADEEFFSYSESDSCCTQELLPSFYSHFSANQLATNLINQNISQLVVQILIEMSKKCIENRNFWLENLKKLALRLNILKNYLGGSNFILSGFSSILKIKDPELADLQISILELVNDLDSPESYSTFMSLLTSENPPINLLLSRFTHLCQTSIKPFVEIDYPTDQGDGDISTTAKTPSEYLEKVKELRERHSNYQIFSPFVEASTIIPLKLLEFQKWKDFGFTVSTWLQIKSDYNDKLVVQQDVELEENLLLKSRVHLVSIGSEKLLTSFYINYDRTLSVFVTIPDVEIRAKSGNSKKSVPPKIPKKYQQMYNKENMDPSIIGLGLAAMGYPESPKVFTRHYLKSRERTESTSKVKEEKLEFPVEFLKNSTKTNQLKLQSKKWIHLSISVRNTTSHIIVLLTVDGLEQEILEIPVASSDNSDEIPLMCIGSSANSFSEEDSLRYSISKMTLFKTCIDSPTMLANLFALGPDTDNFIECHVNNTLFNYGFLSLHKPISGLISMADSHEQLKTLRNLLKLSYLAAEPNSVIGYKSEEVLHGEKMEVLLLGKLPESVEIPSIYRSIILSGGLSSLLFLFARIVELSDDSQVQSLALYILLKISHSNNELFKEFQEKKLFNLIAHVFKHKKCKKGQEMLKAVMDVACGITLIKEVSENSYQVVKNTNLCINHPSLIFEILEHYSIFNQEDPQILDLFLGSLLLMLNQNHQNFQFNLNCLKDHNFLDQLLLFCEANLTDTANSTKISKTTASSIVSLIKLLNIIPCSIEYLRKIVKLILLLHPSSESFVTHERSKFFFILPPNKRTKPTKRMLPRKLGFNIKIQEIYPRKNRFVEPFDDESLEQFKKIQREVSVSPKSSPTNSQLLRKNSKKFEDLEEKDKNRVEESFKKKEVRFQLQTPNKSPKNVKLTPSKIKMRKDALQMRILKMGKGRTKSSPRKKRKNEEDSEIDPAIRAHFEEMMLQNTNDPAAQNYPIARSPSTDPLTGTSNTEENPLAGTYLLHEQLILLMCEFLITLPDDQVQPLFESHLKIEILIVLANHLDPNVRAAIIKLICTVLGRTSPEQLAKYSKNYYWTHLGNQVAISVANSNMIQACMDWIGRGSTSMTTLSRNLEERLIQKEGLVPLIAMLPKIVNDPNLFPKTLKYLRYLIEHSQECFVYMMENGLVASTIKALVNLTCPHEKCIHGTYKILKIIAYKSLVSVGSINGLWELLYGLTYEEKTLKSEKVREAHIFILYFLLKTCVQENPAPPRRSFSRPSFVIQIENCALPPAEVRTRFNLIFERAAQYLVSSDPQEPLSTNEMDFISFILNLTLSGYSQGSLILLWGLELCRPKDLKIMVIKKLWSLIQNGNLFSLECEQKVIRSLILNFVQNNRDAFDSLDAAKLVNYCDPLESTSGFLTIQLSQAIDRTDQLKSANNKEQDHAMEKSIYKHENLVQNCIEVAMRMTREVIDIQNQERRVLINYIRKLQGIDFHREWVDLIQRMTNEGAPWYCQELYSNCWELEPSEGPDHCRRRLKRCTLKVEQRFFLDQFQYKSEYQHKQPLLHYLLETNEDDKYSIRDQIIFNFYGKYLTMDREIHGDIIITDYQLIFLANEDIYNNSIISRIDEISEVWERRYQHKEIAIEFFLTSSKSFLLILDSNYDRELLKKFFVDRVENSSENYRIETIVQKWREKTLTNFEYLMELNKLAGRTYNDLMQYPVFPWILSDYTSSFLDLLNEDSFRRLEKTIATQHKESENHYVENYKYLEQSLRDQPQGIMKPYHYSSHYSNSGTVLHFLVRIPPYTSMFLLYQDHNFDLPDRTFHAMKTTYRLASKDSSTDVKELVPEFFFLPEMLENNEGFNFGKKQNGVLVNDVLLPDWSGGSPRMFTLIHRQALESDYVRKKLNSWIDLVFGCKQKGNAAVSAVNVFHPATYQEFQVGSITDTVERHAFETMIRTYGQMPKQIFENPHPKPKSQTFRGSFVEFDAKGVLESIRGLRWGIYTGSPQLPSPKMVDLHKKIDQKIENLVSIVEKNLFYGLPSKTALMAGREKTSGLNLVLWGMHDQIVRIKSLSNVNSETTCLFHISPVDPITACGSHYKHKNLWFGYKSGKICVLQQNSKTKIPIKGKRSFYNSRLESIIGIKDANTLKENKNEKVYWSSPITLVRHAGKVLDIKISVEFNVAVSIGSDNSTVIWDLNRIEYVRTIEPPCNTLDSRLSLMAVSPTLGDIITIFTPKNEAKEEVQITETSADGFINVNMKVEKCQLRLHTINAKYVNHKLSDDKMTAVCYTAIKEGTGVNAIAVGFASGTIRLYSSWNLDSIREIEIGRSQIECLLYTTHHHLVVLIKDINLIQVLESEADEISGKLPKFNNIVPTYS